MLSLGIFAGEWRMSGSGFIQGKDGQEAVFLELCYVVLGFLV
jgi:hypothetical protein